MAVQTSKDVVYTYWRAYLQGAGDPGDIPYADIFAERFKILNGWARTQPNSSRLKTLFDVKPSETPENRVKRATNLLAISKSLEKQPVRDSLIDQAQDDLNIAFDQTYLLNPKGEEAYTCTLLNDFVDNYDLLQKIVKVDRYARSKYYFIATTVTFHNIEKIRRIFLVLAKQGCDLKFVEIFITFEKTKDHHATCQSFKDLAKDYEKLFSSKAITFSDKADIDKKISNCKTLAVITDMMETSPVAREQFAKMSSDFTKNILPKRKQNESQRLLVDLIICAVVAGIFILALLLYQKTNSKFHNNKT